MAPFTRARQSTAFCSNHSPFMAWKTAKSVLSAHWMKWAWVQASASAIRISCRVANDSVSLLHAH
ncbi:hypothetical protein D3C79_1035980 [compost metagenome]